MEHLTAMVVLSMMAWIANGLLMAVSIISVLLVPVYHVMMDITVIQLGAELTNMIATSAQIHRIKRQLVVRAISRAQQYCRRGSPRLGQIEQFLIARFHS